MDNLESPIGMTVMFGSFPPKSLLLLRDPIFFCFPQGISFTRFIVNPTGMFIINSQMFWIRNLAGVWYSVQTPSIKYKNI